MTPDERREFVLAWANGTVYATNHIPSDLWSLVFMPLAFGAGELFKGWTRADFGKIGLIWADSARDPTAERSINGYPMFAACRLMLKVDWDDLGPRVQEELDRRKDLKP